MLQRPMAIKVPEAEASQEERRAAEQQRRRNEEKEKEAEQREQMRPKRGEPIIFTLLRGKSGNTTESLICVLTDEHKQRGQRLRGSASFEDRRFQIRRASNSKEKS